MLNVFASGSELLAALRSLGQPRGGLVALVISDTGSTAAFATPHGSFAVTGENPFDTVRLVETELRPRWVWWSSSTPEMLARHGLRVATCWDVAAVYRLLFGGWRAEPARIWAVLHELPTDALPTMGQMGLLDLPGDEGSDPDDPIRPDGHLRPEWTAGAWQESAERMAVWATLVLDACALEEKKIASLPGPNGAPGAARSESAAELLCVELAIDGLPIDVTRAEELIGALIGPRPRDYTEEAVIRQQRDNAVLELAPIRSGVDLRNPAHVKAMLSGLGIDVSNTRAHRLEPFRDSHPLVAALLSWRKAERIATTYGYTWLDEHVGPDGRLRGAWTGCDGAAGRMTASAGLHNLPAEMRPAVVAEAGHVFVHADLGQIEPRVLAAVSGDRAFAEATQADDMYSPVAERLRVERSVAKIVVRGDVRSDVRGGRRSAEEHGVGVSGCDAVSPRCRPIGTAGARRADIRRATRAHGFRRCRAGNPR